MTLKSKRTLCGLDGMHAGSPPLGPDNLVRGGQIHVAGARNGHTGLRKLVRVRVLG